MKNVNFDLYRAAIAADEAYQEALIQAYGIIKAQDMRYKKEAQDNPAIVPFRNAKLAADQLWLAEMERK